MIINSSENLTISIVPNRVLVARMFGVLRLPSVFIIVPLFSAQIMMVTSEKASRAKLMLKLWIIS